MGNANTRYWAQPEYTDLYNRYIHEDVAEELLTEELSRLVRMCDDLYNWPGAPVPFRERAFLMRTRLIHLRTEVDYVVIIPRPHGHIGPYYGRAPNPGGPAPELLEGIAEPQDVWTARSEDSSSAPSDSD